MSEVYQLMGNWAGQVIRLYRGDEHFEVEWTVGPIDIKYYCSKSLIINTFEYILSL